MLAPTPRILAPVLAIGGAGSMLLGIDASRSDDQLRRSQAGMLLASGAAALGVVVLHRPLRMQLAPALATSGARQVGRAPAATAVDRSSHVLQMTAGEAQKRLLKEVRAGGSVAIVNGKRRFEARGSREAIALPRRRKAQLSKDEEQAVRTMLAKLGDPKRAPREERARAIADQRRYVREQERLSKQQAQQAARASRARARARAAQEAPAARPAAPSRRERVVKVLLNPTPPTYRPQPLDPRVTVTPVGEAPAKRAAATNPAPAIAKGTKKSAQAPATGKAKAAQAPATGKAKAAQAPATGKAKAAQAPATPKAERDAKPRVRLTDAVEARRAEDATKARADAASRGVQERADQARAGVERRARRRQEADG